MTKNGISASIISIGDELLSGLTVDTNFAFLADRIRRIGIICGSHFTVKDSKKDIKAVLKQALKSSDIVFTIGGLGPTEDDLTVETVAKFTGRRLKADQKMLRSVEAKFRKRGLRMPECSKKQVVSPEGAFIMKNTVGMAPGIALSFEKKLIISMPGPPREFEPMTDKCLIEFLKRKFSLSGKLFCKTLKLACIPESAVNETLKDLFGYDKRITIGICSTPCEIELSVYAPASGRKQFSAFIRPVVRAIYERLGEYVYGEDEDLLEGVVGNILSEKRLTISVAESCTGGALASRITDIPGSSEYFNAGVVTYANAAKTRFLGVPAYLIRKKGAVSKEVAERMSVSAANLFGTDIGVGISGIAGPSGGTSAKPVGLVCIAVTFKGNTKSYEFRFFGGRQAIKRCASTTALNIIRTLLIN